MCDQNQWENTFGFILILWSVYPDLDLCTVRYRYMFVSDIDVSWCIIWQRARIVLDEFFHFGSGQSPYFFELLLDLLCNRFEFCGILDLWHLLYDRALYLQRMEVDCGISRRFGIFNPTVWGCLLTRGGTALQLRLLSQPPQRHPTQIPM
jgi:hypothetical protein